jgi:Icc-related predicted phosphoesterase
VKLLITADLHYSLKQYDWLKGVAPDFDALIIAGDLLDLAGHAELDSQIAVVENYLRRLAREVPTFVCSGNHDGDIETPNGEYVAKWLRSMRYDNLHVDNQTVTLDGLTISVCPWWDGPVTREAVVQFLEESAADRTANWAWLYHSPPKNTPIAWTGKKDLGDEFLNTLIARYHPDFVFCGHIHNAPYRDEGGWIVREGGAWCFNPGRQMAEIPCYIELDTDTNAVKWVSDFDIEERVLCETATRPSPPVLGGAQSPGDTAP